MLIIHLTFLFFFTCMYGMDSLPKLNVHCMVAEYHPAPLDISLFNKNLEEGIDHYFNNKPEEAYKQLNTTISLAQKYFVYKNVDQSLFNKAYGILGLIQLDENNQQHAHKNLINVAQKNNTDLCDIIISLTYNKYSSPQYEKNAFILFNTYIKTYIIHNTNPLESHYKDVVRAIHYIACNGNKDAYKALAEHYISTICPNSEHPFDSIHMQIIPACNLFHLLTYSPTLFLQESLAKKIVNYIPDVSNDTAFILRHCRYKNAQNTNNAVKINASKSLLDEAEKKASDWIKLSCNLLAKKITVESFLDHIKESKDPLKLLQQIFLLPLSPDIIEHCTKVTNLASYKNVFKLMAKIEKNNPKTSFFLGKIFVKIVKISPKISIKEQEELIQLALEQLEYAKEYKAIEMNTHKQIYKTCYKLHNKLSFIYESKNNYNAALEHLILAIEQYTQYTQTTNYKALITCLTRAKKNNTNVYKKYAPIILSIMHSIFETPENYILKLDSLEKNHHDLLTEYSSSNLYTELLHILNKYEKTSEILFCMGLLYEYQKKWVFAHELFNSITNIDHTSKTYQTIMLHTLHASLQSHGCFTEKEIQDITYYISKQDKKKYTSYNMTRLHSIFTHYIDHIVKNKQYDMAYNLILTCLESQDQISDALYCAYAVYKKLQSNKDPYLADWKQKLLSCTLYKHLESYDQKKYTSKEHFYIGMLLASHEQIQLYEKAAFHLEAALKNPSVIKQEETTINTINKICAEFYIQIALKYPKTEQQYSAFLEKAITHGSPEARYNKACILIQNTKNKNDLDEAIQLLKSNIANENPIKSISLCELGAIYFTYCFDKEIHDKIKKYITLDTVKGENYLKESASRDFLPAIQLLASLYAGTLKNIADKNTQHYIDKQKAITCYTTLIDKETTKGPNLWNRGVIYFDLQDYEKALNDFTLVIQENINEEYLRNAWWLSGLIHLKRDSYTNAINCFRAAQTLQNLDNNHISFPFFIGQLDTTTEKKIIDLAIFYANKKDISDDALAWCCLSAQIIINQHKTQQLASATINQKIIADYLLEASQQKKFSAQSIFPFYCSAFDFDTKYTQQGLPLLYKALHNAIKLKKTNTVKAFLQFLEILSKNGFIFAWYILCNYYKKGIELENFLKSLDIKRKLIQNFLDKEMAKKTYKNVLSKLLPLADKYTQAQKNTTVNETAAFILGSMQHHFDDEKILQQSVRHLTLLYKQFSQKSISPYKEIITTMIGKACHKQATISQEIHKKYIYLKDSIHFHYLPAAYTMAQLWIDQQKKQNDSLIKTTDFLDMLHKGANLKDTESLHLLAQFYRITNQENYSTKYLTMAAQNGHVECQQIILALKCIELAHKKNFIFCKEHKESQRIRDGITLLCEQNNTQGYIDLQKAAEEEKSARACIHIAITNLSGKVLKQNIDVAEEYFARSFEYGMKENPKNKNSYLFIDEAFFISVLFYIKTAIKECSEPIKISTIQLTTKLLENYKINKDDFAEILAKTHNTNLKL